MERYTATKIYSNSGGQSCYAHIAGVHSVVTCYSQYKDLPVQFFAHVVGFPLQQVFREAKEKL